MVPSLPLLSCKSSVSVKENSDRKKKKKKVFNRREHLLEVNFLFIRAKFISTPRLRIGLLFYNISWSTKFQLERTLSFKRADPKLTHKEEHFRLSQKLLALIKKTCNTVILEVVIIQIWNIWIIQIKGSKSG